jgi:hypothetical protein
VLFVKGIRGNVKLNPGIKLWCGICFLISVLVAGLLTRLDAFYDRVEACKAVGGDWMGGALKSAFCEPPSESAKKND